MTKHCVEALFIGLTLLALAHIPPKRAEYQIVLAILAAVAFVVGLILAVNGN
jgi:multisubunit Na+/H+ antiporter MnhB subunit